MAPISASRTRHIRTAGADNAGPGESRAFDSFNELVIAKVGAERGVDAPIVRIDYTSSANDNDIVTGIAGSTTSLGWVGLRCENATSSRRWRSTGATAAWPHQ